MKVIVACERSQRVCQAFLDRGADAYSLDIVSTMGVHPERHFICSALDFDYSGFDLVIAHPPCTYLSNVQACRMYLKDGSLDPVRYSKCLASREFFMFFYNLSVSRICIENPRPWSGANLPMWSDIIEPYFFGDPRKKATYLWLKNLPPLFPTDLLLKKDCKFFLEWARSERELTSPAIAAAMAFYWSDLL